MKVYTIEPIRTVIDHKQWKDIVGIIHSPAMNIPEKFEALELYGAQPDKDLNALRICTQD